MVAELAQYDDTGSTEPDTAPHSLDAEQAFLGGLLYDNDLFHQVGFLKPEHFYEPIHGRIFEACAALISAGRRADAVVLKSLFQADDTFDDIGGVEYFALLMECSVTGPAAVEYGKIVFEMFRRRELIAYADAVGFSARQDSDADVAELIEDAEGALFGLAESGSAKSGPKAFAEAMSECVEVASAAFKSGGLSGLSTGLRDLDEKLTGLHPSDLIILAGRPSMGKTALATNMAYSAARTGKSVLFFSLEMSREQLGARILSDVTRIPAFKVRSGNVSEAAVREWMDAARDISGLPLFIDDTGGLQVATLAARARRHKRLHGLDLIVVDYLQLCTFKGLRSSANRVEELSKITAALKELAKTLGVPVLALSQLSRNVENREDKKPQLSDLRESGSIEQDADVVMFVYREAYYKEREKPREDTPEFLAWEEEFERIQNRAEVIIGKQRHGPIGSAKLHFDGMLTKFTDLETRYDDESD